MGKNVFIDYAFIKKYIFLLIILSVIVIINNYYISQDNQYNSMFILFISIISVIVIIIFFFTSLPLIITPNLLFIPRIYSGKFRLGIDIVISEDINNIQFIYGEYPYILISTNEKDILINENRLVSKKYKLILKNHHSICNVDNNSSFPQ